MKQTNKTKNKMNPINYNLLTEDQLTDVNILIACGLILGCTLIYLISSHYATIPIPTKNVEAFTTEEIDAIVNENSVTIANDDNLQYAIIEDSDFDTDVTSDYQSPSDNESTSDDDSILGVDTTDLDLFYMPDVDFNVCSIQELKLFEINSIFYREIAANSVTDEELTQLIYWFSDQQLATNWVNDFILHIITTM